MVEVMKVFSVIGFSRSGKTTTIECLIRELKKRGYRVGSVKEIHFESFAMDADPASNTNRHRMAGAELVTARGLSETNILFPEKLDLERILSFYEGFDYVICEGVQDYPIPTIITAGTALDLESKWNDFVFCISGRNAEERGEYRGVPAISAVSDAAGLADLIEERVCDLPPGAN
jgi:molybdopterin-guanine dinucleotide biosynthesis protein B